MSYPDIEPRILDEWQHITSLVAGLCHVPACLVMRKNAETMEVLSGSQHPDSPYKAFETAPLNGDLYCETVIKTQQSLNVPNALRDPVWDHNPDLDSGMLFYFGVPVNWPDATPFGTLCILDSKEKRVSDEEQELIKRFGHVVELTLELLVSNHDLENRNRELSEAMSTIKTISGIVPLCAWCCKKIQDQSGAWTSLEHYLNAHTDARVSHGMCPQCRKNFLSEFDAVEEKS
jgi:transcriptional regulator with GAF, ATPase, and Fis domain